MRKPNESRKDEPERRRSIIVPTLEEIHIELPQIVNEIAGIPIEDIQPDKTFVNDLDIDSLSMVEIMVAAEEKFGVRIPDDELKRLLTINDVVAYIQQQHQLAQA
jgi:acyl carrier protein